MFFAIILNIYRIITNKSKDNSQKLSRYGNQCLYFRHPPIQHLMVFRVHNSFRSNRIDGGKIQQLPHQKSPSLGDMSLPLMYTGADLKKVKTSQFCDLRDRIKFSEISNFSNQAGRCYPTNAFYRQNAWVAGVGPSQLVDIYRLTFQK